MRTPALFISPVCLFLLVSCGRSPEAYLEKGNSYFTAGKYEEAALNYRKAVSKDARFGEAYYRLGLTALKTKDATEAYRALSSAVEILPQRADVKVSLADLLLPAYLGDKRRPVRYYNELAKLSGDLLAQNPNSYDGLRIKGNLAWSDGRLKDAAELFARADAVKPGQPELIAVWTHVLFLDGQDLEGERLANQLLQTHKDFGKIYDVLYRHYASKNRPADAENILKAKVSNNPRESDYAIQLATFYASAGKREQMIAALQPLTNPGSFPDGHLKLGDFYSARQDWPEASREYEEGAKANPQQRMTYLKRIADVSLQQGKGEEASGIVREILKEKPDDEAAQAINASILLKTGTRDNVDTAVNVFQNLVKKSPENALWRFNLGRALMVKGDLDGARSQFLEAVKRRPGLLPPRVAAAEVSRLKHDYTQTLRYAGEVLALKPDFAPARLLKAVGLIGTHRYAEARSELVDLERQFPKDRQVQFQLAILEVTEKKFPSAEARLQKLYSEGKNDPSALAALVEAYRAEDRQDKALSLLADELKKSPDSSTVRALLADTALRSGKYDLALEQYRALLAKGMRSPQLEERLGTVYELKGNLSQAVASFQAAKSLAPRDAGVANALADALRLAGRKNEAIAAYRSVLELDPQNVKAMNHLAYLIVDEDGKLAEAQSLVEKAMRKSPRDPDFADTLGLVYLKKNLPADAAQVFRTLVKKYPDNPLFRYHYGLALFDSGQKTSARTELEAALPQKPSEDVRRGIETTLAKIRYSQ